jgi:hypothetical protein
LCHRPGLASVEIDGEVVLYDGGQQRLHRLNPSATILWTCLDGQSTLADIAQDVAEVLAADAGGVLIDVLAAAEQLTEQGLATYVSDRRPA